MTRSTRSGTTCCIPTRSQQVAYVNEVLPRDGRVVVAASDYMKALPAVLGRWLGDDLLALGHRWTGPQ